VATAGLSDKRILPALLLCFLLGVFGAHRFYAGKIGTRFFQARCQSVSLSHHGSQAKVPL